MHTQTVTKAFALIHTTHTLTHTLTHTHTHTTYITQSTVMSRYLSKLDIHSTDVKRNTHSGVELPARLCVCVCVCECE